MQGEHKNCSSFQKYLILLPKTVGECTINTVLSYPYTVWWCREVMLRSIGRESAVFIFNYSLYLLAEALLVIPLLLNFYVQISSSS